MLRPALLAIFSLAALLIAGFEFVNVRTMDRERPAVALERLGGSQPWGGLAGREAARLLETRWRLDPQASAEGLWWHLHRYPMDPWRWLLMSRIARQVDDQPELLPNHMRTAVGIQPGNREVRWQSAQLAQAVGDPDLLVEHLRLWLSDQPHMSDRALFVAGRWIQDPGELVDRVLPDTEDHRERAMRYARTSRNPALADALWQRLDQPRSPDERVVAEYILVQQAAGDADALMAVWQDLDPRYQPGQVPAGQFAFNKQELPAFGWNLRTSEGVTIEPVKLDPDTRPHQTSQPANKPTSQRLDEISTALQITFQGKENVNLNTPLIRFPIPEPGHYHLTGHWRAENLTTRALPYIHVRNEDGNSRHTLHVPGTDFEWTAFRIPIEITGPDQTVRFQFIRRATEAFDRYIEGTVWLAGLAIEAAGE